MYMCVYVYMCIYVYIYIYTRNIIIIITITINSTIVIIISNTIVSPLHLDRLGGHRRALGPLPLLCGAGPSIV